MLVDMTIRSRIGARRWRASNQDEVLRRRLDRPSRAAARTSFAQAGEDLIVQFAFEQLRIAHPSYLDIGAYDPFHFSNTALLHLTGSRGINIEPNPDAIGAFARYRPEDVNLNIGCSDVAGRLTYYRLSEPILNTFSQEAAAEAIAESTGRITIDSTADVEVSTVADVLGLLGRRCPEFLSLDVEGLDLRILRTLAGWPGRPVVVCVETITYSETRRNRKVTEVTDLLTDQGYRVFADTYINTVFVLAEQWRWR
jgi:FkbM family methyltransferase